VRAFDEAEAGPDGERRADDEERVGFVDAAHGVGDFLLRHRLAEEHHRRLEHAAAAVAVGNAERADDVLRDVRVAVGRKVRFVRVERLPWRACEPLHVHFAEALLHRGARQLGTAF